MNLQWYPGHMTKAKRQMQEDIKLVDLVIELLDSRTPLSSRNPDIDSLAKGKQRLVLLNKSDLSDPATNNRWQEWFEAQGIHAALINSRTRTGMNKLTALIREACKEKIERDRKRGIMNRPIRAMVVGIPNVGKSTFINSMAGKAAAKTGNKPGVTKGKQWIRLNKEVELLDTPGILWPKFDDQAVGVRLALIGSIRDEITDAGELSIELIRHCVSNCKGVLNERYGCDESASATEMLAQIAEAKACLKKGGEPDYDKAAVLVLDDFRSGRLGRLSLERPEGDGRA